MTDTAGQYEQRPDTVKMPNLLVKKVRRQSAGVAKKPYPALYFDTAATTRVAPEVVAAMVEQLNSADGMLIPPQPRINPVRLPLL
jgi:hypothetical protein